MVVLESDSNSIFITLPYIDFLMIDRVGLGPEQKL